MNRSKIHPILVLAFFISITSTSSVHAWSFITGNFSAPYNQCKTCHVSNSNLAMNPYGDDYLAPAHRASYTAIHSSFPVTKDCSSFGCHSGKGYPILQNGLDAMDSDNDLFTNQHEFSAGTFPGDATDFPVDNNAPTITSFSLPTTSSTLSVAINSLTASDDIGVTGYLVSATGLAPTADDAGWRATAPTHYRFSTADMHTLYAWAKDAAGNVSAPSSQQVDTTPSQDRVNAPPIAAAGVDQMVAEGQTVVLNGHDSTDDLGIITYAWVQLDGPGGAPIDASDPDAVVISDPFDAQISFVTPSVGSEGTTLTFRLTVTDGDNAQDSAEVEIAVDDNGITAFDGIPGTVSVYSINGQPVAVRGSGANACIRFAPLDVQEVANDWQQPKDAMYGCFDFELKVSDPANTSITIYLPSPVPDGYRWFKYTHARGWFDFSRDLISKGSGDGAVFNADRTQITIHITDNGEFDDDPTPNMIRDPGGLASGLSSSISIGSNSFGSSGGGCFIDVAVESAECRRPAAFPAAVLILFFAVVGILNLRRNRRIME